MDAKKIEYSMQLNNKKVKLVKEMNNIEQQIDENQSRCNHVIVRMKNFDVFPNYGNIFRCLICGRSMSNINGYDMYIDAQNKYNALETDEKFDLIQTMALGIIRQNPEITRLEFICQLNKLINGSSELEQEKENKLVKKMSK